MARYKFKNGERIKFTKEEEVKRDQEETAWNDGGLDRELYELRLERNKLLADSDWEVTMAKEKGTNLSSAFKTWRQDLRDITSGLDTIEKVKNKLELMLMKTINQYQAVLKTFRLNHSITYKNIV